MGYVRPGIFVRYTMRYLLLLLFLLLPQLSTPAAAAPPLAQLGVHLSDLRAGYTFGRLSGYLSAHDTADRFGWGATDATFYQHGWQQAYEAPITHSAAPWGYVFEDLYRFTNAQQARWAYCLDVGRGCARDGAVPMSVGDESISY
jgi:hypothetical protein